MPASSQIPATALMVSSIVAICRRVCLKASSKRRFSRIFRNSSCIRAPSKSILSKRALIPCHAGRFLLGLHPTLGIEKILSSLILPPHLELSHDDLNIRRKREEEPLPVAERTLTTEMFEEVYGSEEFRNLIKETKHDLTIFTYGEGHAILSGEIDDDTIPVELYDGLLQLYDIFCSM
jgi:hypothetical protein